MLIKRVLMVTTAMTLPLSAALADGNEAFLSQSGPANSASVDQSAGDNNKAGSSGKVMRQRAGQGPETANTLTILQSGSNNSIGLDGSGVDQYAQKSNGNTASVSQLSDGNTVGSITQVTRFGGAYASGNSLTVTQGVDTTGASDNNTINRINQDRVGGDNGSTATVSMTGADNLIDNINQATLGAGPGNTMTVSISGNDNGNGALSGFAAASGATTSSLIQGTRYYNGNSHGDNMLDLDISGGSNEFGVTQLGNGNRVGTLSISGNTNQMGVYQQGNANVLSLSNIGGERNNVGVEQLQDSNIAGVNVSGDDNSFGVWQDGIGNTADVAITGDFNGASSGLALGGAAMTAAGGSLLFAEGLVKQQGDSNIVNVSYTGDNNLFGTVQDGSSNTITGTTIGNSNQAVVVQVGGSNMASYTQTGNGNNAGISQ